MAISDNIPAWLNAIVRRLRDTRGFMLAEQLISIIFIGLLCIAVAAGLQAAMSSYASITTQTQADSMLSNAVEAVSNELVYALDVDDGTPPSFTSATLHEKATLENRNNAGIWLKASTDSCLAPVQNGLVPKLDSLVFNKKNTTDAAAPITYVDTWTFKVTITRENGTSPLAETEITVKRIGS